METICSECGQPFLTWTYRRDVCPKCEREAVRETAPELLGASEGTTTTTLTRDQILAEPAGRQLDAWVAEHVMGWTDVAPARVAGFRPSTDIAAAWRVVDELTLWRYSFDLQCFARGGPVYARFQEGYRQHAAEAGFGQVPLAISRAALLARLG